MHTGQTRRELLTALGMGAAAAAFAPWRTWADDKDRPNILWILSEDICPDLSCYGTPAVKTPNLDKLASEGIRYTNAFTTAPVCSASRSAMITGMYQTSIDAHLHRSHRGENYPLPDGIKLVTDYFREAGYFTANIRKLAPGIGGSGKNDFNFSENGKPFDGAHWNQRTTGQPFFAQLSISITHRGKHWQTVVPKQSPRIDPAGVELPPYLPDHPVAREDWATYLESIQVMDGYVGEILKLLDQDGLSDNTIVLFIGDHGRCQVRGKQWIYDAGIHIPLIVRWPGKFKVGEVCDDLVSGIDIAPTLLELAGIAPPKHMQGQVFLGPDKKEREYIFAARDRCDETIECIRCVRDKQYKYIRNYMSYRPYMAGNVYKDTSYPIRNLLRELHAEGKLTPEQAQWMAERKPPEELYDIRKDPCEVRNLAGSPEHQDTLKRLRAAHVKWMKDTGDLGLIPEPELLELTGKYGHASNILKAKENAGLIDRIRATIEAGERSDVAALTETMGAPEPSVRWWAATWLGNIGEGAAKAEDLLERGLSDPSESVRVALALALCRMGQDEKGLPALITGLQSENQAVRHYAALALEDLGERAGPALDALKAARKDKYDGVRRVAGRMVDALEHKGR